MSKQPTQAPSAFNLSSVAQTITQSAISAATSAFNKFFGGSAKEELEGEQVRINESGMFEAVGKKAVKFAEKLNSLSPVIRVALIAELINVVGAVSQTVSHSHSDSTTLQGRDDIPVGPGAIVGTVLSAVMVAATAYAVVNGIADAVKNQTGIFEPEDKRKQRLEKKKIDQLPTAGNPMNQRSVFGAEQAERRENKGAGVQLVEEQIVEVQQGTKGAVAVPISPRSNENSQ